jgi:hypothetical protein
MRLGIESVGVGEGVVNIFYAGGGVDVLRNVEAPQNACNRDEKTILGEQLSWTDAPALYVRTLLSADGSRRAWLHHAEGQ